jgi:predicted RND superfamily exporter protein
VGSLAIGDLIPIRKFGIFAGCSTVLALLFMYILVPAALSFLHARYVPPAEAQKTSSDRKTARRKLGSRMLRAWSRFVIQAQVPLVLLGIMSIGLFGMWSLQIQTAVKLKALFSPGAEVLQNYSWLEKHLGPLVPVEIVLRFPINGESEAADRLKLTADLQESLARIPGVGGIISTATFSPELLSGSSARATGTRTLFKRNLERRKAELIDSGYLSEKDQEQLWRISARVPAMSDVDYGAFLADIRGVVERTLDDEQYPAAQEAGYVICGGVPLFNSASKQLLRDLQISFLSAFLLIWVSMFVLVYLAMARSTPGSGFARGWSLFKRASFGSVISMIPNIFPVVLVFGTMGVMGFQVDIGAMMTASVALGIAVDDTLHYLTWFQRGLDETNNRRKAVMGAFKHCAQAMIQTSFVCSLGFLAFSPSEFVPIARFAWIMCALLFAALLGDMMILPALLVSSLGRVFSSKEE